MKPTLRFSNLVTCHTVTLTLSVTESDVAAIVEEWNDTQRKNFLPESHTEDDLQAASVECITEVTRHIHNQEFFDFVRDCSSKEESENQDMFIRYILDYYVSSL